MSYQRIRHQIIAKQWQPVPIDNIGETKVFWCNVNCYGSKKPREHAHITTSRGLQEVQQGDWIVLEKDKLLVYSPEDFKIYFTEEDKTCIHQ